jgi:hypothetical protein
VTNDDVRRQRSRSSIRWRIPLALLAALALPVLWLAWSSASMPGRSFSGATPRATPEELELAARLRDHVEALAGAADPSASPGAPGIGERNLTRRPEALADAARVIEARLAETGARVTREPFEVTGSSLRAENVVLELAGGARADEIVLVGAHYDTAEGSPGANDNASGCAALIELARALARKSCARTLRFVAFANEEPPYFATGDMGSVACARACRARGDDVVAMLSLETLGCFDDRPGSQRYPLGALAWIYPDRGDFVAFVGNRPSRDLVRRSIATFRSHARVPSEGAALFESIPGVGWSDHRSFWAEGYPALMVTDTALFRDANYHEASDTAEKLDYERLARVVLGLERVLEELAGL